MLERRRIEAAILKHVYDTLRTSHGRRRGAADAGRRRAGIRHGTGRRDGRAGQWQHLNANLHRSPGAVDARRGRSEARCDREAKRRGAIGFNVTRCKYAEMYAVTWGWGDRSSPLLSAQRRHLLREATTSASSSSGPRPSCKAPARPSDSRLQLREGCQGVTPGTTEVFAAGGYRFIPAVFQYSGGVAAEAGAFRIERVRFTQTAPPGDAASSVSPRSSPRAGVH